MNEMSQTDWALLAGIVASVLIFMVGLLVHDRHDKEGRAEHEQRAVEREERAEYRHDREMKELGVTQELTREAIADRSDLVRRVGSLEAQQREYDKHLSEIWEAMGGKPPELEGSDHG